MTDELHAIIEDCQSSWQRTSSRTARMPSPLSRRSWKSSTAPERAPLKARARRSDRCIGLVALECPIDGKHQDSPSPLP